MKFSKQSGYIEYEVGDRINDHIEVSEIREGGLGRVYFGFCLKRRKHIVVKTIKKNIWEDRRLYDTWARYCEDLKDDTLPANGISSTNDYILFIFFREARITCQMKGHLNVINGLNLWWTDHGQIFFECDLIEDVLDLEDFCEKIENETKKRRIGILEALHLAISFCNAMIYINDEGVTSYNLNMKSEKHQATAFVHRDIKPENILVTRRNLLKVIDLGLAKYITPRNPTNIVSSSPPKVLTPNYHAPEQGIDYENVSVASDIYSFGATLYRILGGQPKNLPKVHTTEPPPQIPGVPKALMEVLNKCLVFLPRKRYQNFRELKTALIEVIEQIKNREIEIRENLRCNSCGLVANTPADLPDISAPATGEGKNDHTFIAIPAGSFFRGCNPEHEKKLLAKFGRYLNEPGFPEQYEEVHLEAFEIDKYTVTNRQYYNFIKATHHSPPSHWNTYGGGMPFHEDQANHPVANVSYEDAQAYCQWVDGRLSTGDEWEKAARGPEGNLYPWGNTYSSQACNSAESGNGGTVPVDAYENGKSPYGCYQMTGNVLEWVEEPHPRNPEFHFLRGGSWGQSCELLGLPFLHDLAAGPREHDKLFGFRVARDISSSSANDFEATTIILKEEQDLRCSLCNGRLIPFDIKDIKIPEKNIFTWNGFFDIE